MKKLIMISGVSILWTGILFSQVSGNGSESNPYTGSVNGSVTWYPDLYANNTIYALNLSITNGATLTISSGQFEGGLLTLGNNTLTIGTGCSFVISPGTGVTVNQIINSGTLRLESNSDEAGVSSLIHNSYDASGGGVTQTRLFLKGGSTSGGEYIWHYISSPVSGIAATTYSTQNLAQYIESLVTGTDNYVGWVAFDGYQYSTGSITGNTFSTLSLGKGYTYHLSGDQTVSLNGAINLATQSASVTSGTGYPDYQGFNLLGNPFASCLSWDTIIRYYNPVNLLDAIYFTHNGLISSYVNGIGSDGGTGEIPPMQGFFVKASAASTVSLNQSARVHQFEQMRYKKSAGESARSSDTISFVRLKMKGTQDSADLVVRFNNKATTAFDKSYDAFEFSKTSGLINIWTNTENTSYSINGIPFPVQTYEIPVGMNLKQPGTYKLLPDGINLLGNYAISLRDLHTNQTVDLKKGEFIEFMAQPGLNEGRFVLSVTRATTDVTSIPNQNDLVRVYAVNETITIQVLSNELAGTGGSATVYDITGRKLRRVDDINWLGKGDIKEISMYGSGQGVYIVEIISGSYRHVQKVTLSR